MLNAEFWSRAVEYWVPDAEETFRRFDQGEIVIIGAPWGTGKSRLYSRALERICNSRRIESTSRLKWENGEPARIWGAAHPDGYEQSLPTEGGDEGKRFLEAPGLVIWIEEPVNMDRHNSIDNLDNWRTKRSSSGRSTFYLVNNVGRTSYERETSAEDIIRSAKNINSIVTFQELQTKHLPEQLIATSLDSLNIKGELIDFIINPENQAFRQPRMIGYLFGDELANSEGRSVEDLPPSLPKSLNQLKVYLTSEEDLDIHTKGYPRFTTLVNHAIGGSAKDLVASLKNLGVFKGNRRAQIGAGTMLKNFWPETYESRGKWNRDKEGQLYMLNILECYIDQVHFVIEDPYFD